MEGEEIKGGGAGSMRLRGMEGEEIKGGGGWFYEAMGECGRRNQGRGVDSGFCWLAGIGEKKLEGGRLFLYLIVLHFLIFLIQYLVKYQIYPYI
ncbi:unnamed protein product [Prunus armeniaca]|uniref:Uncharacterized protein n=1 Tax=Prunus armeniaca TaxID=36596 RepID=A0A6J5UQ30_PRUAR|nr:unnamed protein product [Prunus armeniaca]